MNLIGDHTDYTGGLVMPMAIDRSTRIEFTAGGDTVTLTSADEDGAVRLGLITGGGEAVPSWGRYVRAVRDLVPAPRGIDGHITSDIPVGAGLSSSAALEVATALALGFDGSPTELATLTRAAEHAATGVPCGIMDQLVISAAREGHAALIDCHSLGITHVPVPAELRIVVRFVARRTLEGSEYADRVRECAEAEQRIGPLRSASVADTSSIPDPVVRRRARHVVTENERVRQFALALTEGRHNDAGGLMTESHRSLAADFSTSNAAMDAAVESALAVPGVLGARMTGGGFGGCIVVLCEPGARVDGWDVRAVDGARVEQAG